MDLETNAAKLIINNLVLIGKRKKYQIPFSKGLNIIYGDSDTGKSSILNLIDYCLGASEVYLYDEIESTGLYCLLEVDIIGQTYTIKRDIFNSRNNIEVYQCAYDDIEKIFPKYYSPTYNVDSRKSYFSEFLLSSMNIPVVKVKQAPTKEDSTFSTVSFRDIFKYCFLNQDMVGSTKIFGDNPHILLKLKESFKLMFNVLDIQITELESLISQKSKERDELNSKNKSINSFLRETQIDTLDKLEEKNNENDKEIAVLDSQIKALDEGLLSNSKEFDNLRISIYSIEKSIESHNQERVNKDQELKQNIALKYEYDKDINKIQAILEVLDRLPTTKDTETSCPICDQIIKVSELKNHFSNSNSDSLNNELKGLKRRKKDLQSLIERLREQISSHNLILKNKSEELHKLKLEFDTQTKNLVTPFIAQRDSLISKRSTLISDKKNNHHFYKIRMQQVGLEAEINVIEKSLTLLRENLKKLKESTPSIEKILENLANSLQNFLQSVGMRNIYGISLSGKTYLPVIRNRDYEKITSGGVRTLASVGYYLSLLEYSANNIVNYPSLLLIDTLAKYIGKTKESDYINTDPKEDEQEGMKDADKYSNMYRYLLKLCDKYDNIQIIIVDNDIPYDLENTLKPYIRKHFSTKADGIEIQKGFIDDI